jgi:hypothetical protein
VNSWGAFAKTAQSAEVEEEGERISVVSTRNLGVAEGFQADPVRTRVAEKASLEVLGAIVRDAFVACKNQTPSLP